MKGRFRKGKKAFRMAVRSSRQANFERQYQRWLIRKRMSAVMASKVVRAALSAACSSLAMAMIQSDIHTTYDVKAIRSAQQAIKTAQTIAAIFNE